MNAHDERALRAYLRAAWTMFEIALRETGSVQDAMEIIPQSYRAKVATALGH